MHMYITTDLFNKLTDFVNNITQGIGIAMGYVLFICSIPLLLALYSIAAIIEWTIRKTVKLYETVR